MNFILLTFFACHTFNSGWEWKTYLENEQYWSNDGLTLNVDLRRYNYSDSPNTDAGIKILLHPQDEPLHPDRFGVAASPGTISYVH